MGKRRNQPLIDSDSASNNDSGSDLDSVKQNSLFQIQKLHFVICAVII